MPAPEYYALLRSNTAPLQSYEATLRYEIRYFTRLIDEAASNVFADDSSSMKTHTTFLENLILSHRRILEPVRRIPANILQLIFLNHEDARLQEGMGFRTMTVSITHICREWRRVALYTLKLWTNIFVDLDAFPSESFFVQSATWLARTEDQPLDITLRSSTNITFVPFLDRYIMIPFLTQAHRWNQLNLHIHVHDIPLIFPLSTRFIELTSIHLYLRCRPDYFQRIDPSIGLIAGPQKGLTPALTTIEIAGAPVHSDLGIPWSQIQKCTLHQQSDRFSESLLNTIAHCVCYCSISNSIVFDPIMFPRTEYTDKSPHEPFPMHCLTDLRITETSLPSLVWCLATLAAPHTTNLEVNFDAEARWPREAFSTFLQSSSFFPRLLRFRSRSNMSATDLIASLTRIPSIRSMILINPKPNMTMCRGYWYPIVSNETALYLSYMNLNFNSLQILPHLEHLELDGEGDLNIDILAILLGRRRMQNSNLRPRLTSLFLGARLIDTRHRNALSRVEKNGLEIRFTGERS